MGDFVRADVTPLGESFVADIAREGLFACMATLMCLDYYVR